MLRNYLKTALRNLKRHKLYSFINVLSLTVGFICCTLIALYVKHELSYDNYFKNADNIYRITTTHISERGTSIDVETPMPLGRALQNEYPEIKNYARIFFDGDGELVSYNQKKFIQPNIAFADSTFFKIFSLKILQGNPARLLNSPHSIVLTEAAAEKYFGSENPVGKILRLKNKYDFTVTGVMQNIPSNTHFNFEMLGSFSEVNSEILFADFSNQWAAYIGSYTYVLLPAGTSVENLRSKTADFIMKQRKFPAGVSVKLDYQKLLNIHLHSDYVGEIQENNSISNLMIVSTIGLFILLLACFNFINLATARSSQRLKEIGVRKVLGAVRTQLFFQFLGEAVILAVISLAISIAVSAILLPSFANLLNTKLTFNLFSNTVTLLFIVLGTIISIVAGIYPSFYLSKFKPILAVKNIQSNSKNSKSGSGTRKVLVIAQFGISIGLIICTLVVLRQLNFMKNHELGFKKDHTVTIPFGEEITSKNYQAFENRILSIPGVTNVSAANSAPVSDDVFDTSLFPKGLDGGDRISINLKFVDKDYKNIYGLKLLAGRFYSKDFSDDWRNAIVVNEATVKSLGLKNPQEAIGKKYLIGLGRIEPEIIGVVKDFNIESLRSNIKPLVMINNPEYFREFSIRIKAVNTEATLAGLKNAWQEFSPNFPFRYSFLDDYITSLYRPEEKTGTIISTFSFLAILIACLGLIGLASFIFETRKKEIGIRKVLGAGVPGLINLLNSQFIKLVLVANIFAWPAAYYFMNKWLQNFAYKIDLSFWTFILVGFMSVIIAFLTISIQAVKASVENPINSLKSE